jgi:hypothetical protein
VQSQLRRDARCSGSGGVDRLRKSQRTRSSPAPGPHPIVRAAETASQALNQAASLIQFRAPQRRSTIRSAARAPSDTAQAGSQETPRHVSRERPGSGAAHPRRVRPDPVALPQRADGSARRSARSGWLTGFRLVPNVPAPAQRTLRAFLIDRGLLVQDVEAERQTTRRPFTRADQPFGARTRPGRSTPRTSYMSSLRRSCDRSRAPYGVERAGRSRRRRGGTSWAVGCRSS